jgi:molybdopterin-biosynthesis enzyme MoeA-like protein
VILNAEEQEAQYRMAIFPEGPNIDVMYLHDELWVPVVGIDSKVFILPGVPQLFEQLLTLLLEYFDDRIAKDNKFKRYFIKTQLSESQISPFLKVLQKKADAEDIKVGSYPHMEHDFNTVSILGRNKDDKLIRSLVDEAVVRFKGEEIDAETERQYSVR